MNEERKIEAEEVAGVTAPPKARVSDVVETFERKRDYLEGFLSQKPAAPAVTEPGENLYEAVIDALHAHETALVAECRDALRAVPGVTLYGPDDSAGIVSFNVAGVHAHDTATILDDEGVAVRAGHHCAQPLMEVLGVAATARASFAAHSDASDIEALVRGLHKVKRIFG